MALLWFLQDLLGLRLGGRRGVSFSLKDSLKKRKARNYSSKVTLWQVILITKLLNKDGGGDHISLSLELQ